MRSEAKQTTTRRSAMLTALAAVAATGGAKAAIEATAVDPVFTAIAAWHDAHADYKRTRTEFDVMMTHVGLDTPDAVVEATAESRAYFAATDVDHRRLEACVQTMPTTLAGVAAFASFLCVHILPEHDGFEYCDEIKTAALASLEHGAELALLENDAGHLSKTKPGKINERIRQVKADHQTAMTKFTIALNERHSGLMEG